MTVNVDSGRERPVSRRLLLGGVTAGAAGLASAAGLFGSAPAARAATSTGNRFRVREYQEPGTSAAEAFNAAAAAAKAGGGGIIDLEGGTWTFNDQLVVDGNDIAIDARGSMLTFNYADGASVVFGNGTTTANNLSVWGGFWRQGNAVRHPLFETRGVRVFETLHCQGRPLYMVHRWGRAQDSALSYKWWEMGCEWNLRQPAVGGHSHGYLIENSAGGWYRVMTQIEGNSQRPDADETTAAAVGAYWPPEFAYVRFDHMSAQGGIIRGFAHGMRVENSRLVNVNFDPSFRIDDCTKASFSALFTTALVANGNGPVGLGSINFSAMLGGVNAGHNIDIEVAHASADVQELNIDVVANRTGKSALRLVAEPGQIRTSRARVKGIGWDPTDPDTRFVDVRGTVDLDLVGVSVGKRGGNAVGTKHIIGNETPSSTRVRISDDVHLANGLTPAVSTVFDPNIGDGISRFCAIDVSGRIRTRLSVGSLGITGLKKSATETTAAWIAPSRGRVVAVQGSMRTISGGSAQAVLLVNGSPAASMTTPELTATSPHGRTPADAASVVVQPGDVLQLQITTSGGFAPNNDGEFSGSLEFQEC